MTGNDQFQNNMKTQECIFVLGMHRSGTSALTGMLSLLGVDLGTDIFERDCFNEKGYFENKQIWHVDEDILSSLGITWDSPVTLQLDWRQQDALDIYKIKAREVIESQFAHSEIIGIKDPRISVLVPFWEEVMKIMGIHPNYVIMVREPLEVALSLQKRDGFPLEKSLLLWVNYMFEAERYTRGSRRCFCRFDELIKKPADEINRIANTLKLQFPKMVKEIKEAGDLFLQSDLKHFNDLKGSRDFIYKFAESFYELLLNLASKEKNQQIIYDSIDDLRQQYNNLHSYFYNDDFWYLNSKANCFIPNNYHTKFIVCDDAKGDNKAIIKKITGYENQFEIEVADSTGIKGILFEPLNDQVMLKINSITAITKDNCHIKITQYTSNASQQFNEILIFNTDNPQIFFNTDCANLDKIIIHVSYSAFGDRVTELLSIILKEEKIIKMLEKDIEKKNQLIKSFYGSYSWKIGRGITAPVRLGKRILVKFFKGLRKFIGIIFPVGTRKRAIVKSVYSNLKSFSNSIRNSEVAVCCIKTSTDYRIDSVGDSCVINSNPVKCSFNNGLLEIQGWAVDRIAKDIAGGVYINIDGRKYKTDYGFARQDVSEVFKNNKYLYSGFKLCITSSEITEGKHIIALKILTKNKRAYYKFKEPITVDIDAKKDSNVLISDLEKKSLKEEASALKFIAFYLPQFHPIPENDQWWGKGFTEWTNVTKALPQYLGHYQPHLPGDLGLYDLRVPEVREEQARLAKEYGIYGFCYHHYWFRGKKLLQRPFEEVLKLKKPDLPFCLCWANENWTRTWDGNEKDILIAQSHSREDDKNFIHDLIPAFLDERYIRINGRPLLIVYRVGILPNPRQTADIWRQECLDLGIGDIYLCAAQSFGITDPRPYGFDAAVEFPPHGVYTKNLKKKLPIINPNFEGCIHDYYELIEVAKTNPQPDYTLFRGIIPSWDNTARKNKSSHIIANSSPEAYKSWLKLISEYTIRSLPEDERFVFINAWNEWGEGCHLEPDCKYGNAFLRATKEVLLEHP